MKIILKKLLEKIQYFVQIQMLKLQTIEFVVLYLFVLLGVLQLIFILNSFLF